MSALTIARFPTQKPTRHPAIPYDLDIEKNSTAISLAPGTCRMLGGLPVKEKSA